MMPTASYKMKSTIVKKKKKKLLLTGCTNKKTDYYDQKKLKRLQKVFPHSEKKKYEKFQREF